MNQSRSKNTKRNIIVGGIDSGLALIFGFFNRSIIIYYLGIQYLGLSSLFTSVLSVLNLAELGFSSAIVVNMYKPVAENNTEQVCAYLLLYRKVYRIIGCTILIIGTALMPFIPNIVSGSVPADINLYHLYFLYLLQTTISYFFFGYKNSILNVMQRVDIVKLINILSNISRNILQFLVLIVFHSFYYFVIVYIITTLVSNLLTGFITIKFYPEFVCKGLITQEQKKTIKKQVSGLMISNIGSVARNSLDNIIISSLLGLALVAVYSNYYLIFNSVFTIICMITQAMQPSVANSIAIESIEKNYNDLRKFQFIMSWIVAWCAICMLVLYQPFMQLWVGNENMLSTIDMLLFVCYFYAISMTMIRNLYYSGKGLWWYSNLPSILESVGNVVLNIVLGKLFGITGILIATIVTVIIFNFLWKTNILFSKYFKISTHQYYVDHLIYILVFLLEGGVTYAICSLIKIDTMFDFIFRASLCVLIPNLIMWIIFRKNLQFLEAKRFITRVLKVRD